jgi:hypothetical protein
MRTAARADEPQDVACAILDRAYRPGETTRAIVVAGKLRRP